MSNSEYKKHAEFIYSDLLAIEAFETYFLKARNKKFQRKGHPAVSYNGINKKFFQEIYPILIDLKMDSKVGEWLYKSDSAKATQIIKMAFVPLKKKKLGSSNYGLVLLLWMCSSTPKIANDLYDKLNTFEKRDENPLEFKPYILKGTLTTNNPPNGELDENDIVEEKQTQARVQHKKVGAASDNTGEQSLHSMQSQPTPTSPLSNKIIQPWIPPQPLPSPQKGEVWKITDRWHPHNASAYWTGWKTYFLGLPKNEAYFFNNIIWTENDIRAVARSISVCSTVFSFPIGRHNHQQVKQHDGVALFGRKERHSEDVQLASVNPDNTAFVFSDELVFAYTENVQDGPLQKMYFKPPLGDCEFTRHMYRHPYYKSDKRHIDRYGYRRVLAVNSDGDIIVFGNHGYGRNYKKSQIDIFKYTKGNFNKIDEWEGSLISNKDLLPHPRLPKLFFRMPDRVERVCDTPIILIGDDQWKITSDRHTVAWHPDLPIILVNSTHKNEKNKTALLIIDLETNTCIEQRQTSGSLTTVEWSPDGRFIVFATVGNALSRWDLNSNTVDNMFSNNSAVERVSISPSGDRVAVQDWGSRGNIAIFDINTFEAVTEFKGTFMDFKETPWDYSGRYIAYVLEGEVLVRRLEF